MTHKPPWIDVDVVMRLLETILHEAPRQNISAWKLFELARAGKIVNSRLTVVRYLGYLTKHGLVMIQRVQGPSPFREVGYYTPTVVGERQVRLWQEWKGGSK
jgi:DNA-binding PadR family transcriptional regulator